MACEFSRNQLNFKFRSELLTQFLYGRKADISTAALDVFLSFLATTEKHHTGCNPKIQGEATHYVLLLDLSEKTWVNSRFLILFI